MPDTISAAVYFDDHDQLVVVDRNNRVELFNLSPYRRLLDLCVVYLNEAHTRGTDVPFPAGTRAAVTLEKGKGVNKDKLV